MKARVSKPSIIETQEMSFVDQMNEAYMPQTGSAQPKSGFSSMKSSLVDSVPTQLKLAVAYLSGDVANSMKDRSSATNSPNLGTQATFRMGSHGSSIGNLTGVAQLEAVKQTVAATADKSGSKYLQIRNLTKKSIGGRQDRYAAINKKVETNIRLLQTDDYKVFKKIRKVQNLGGTTITLSVSAFFMTVFAKGLSNSVKLNLMKTGLMCIFMTGGVLGHYTWKYAKFLDHLNTKYFYSASIAELEDNKLIKTNHPKDIVFEGSNWSLKTRLAGLCL